MKAQGYMVEAEWDGAALRVAATSKMSRVALLGEAGKTYQLHFRKKDAAQFEQLATALTPSAQATS